MEFIINGASKLQNLSKLRTKHNIEDLLEFGKLESINEIRIIIDPCNYNKVKI